jgi:hypothetical protein
LLILKIARVEQTVATHPAGSNRAHPGDRVENLVSIFRESPAKQDGFMMGDPVPQLTDAVQACMDVDALNRTPRKGFDQIVPPEVCILWPGNPGPEPK